MNDHVPESERQTSTLKVPLEMVGCIIGTRGSQIRKVRKASHATIQILDKQGDRLDRDVVITGTKDNVSSALKMIQELLELERKQLESIQNQ